MSRCNHEVPRLTYRVDEVSRLLGVPKATIYRWISDGNLPAAHFGRVLLVPVEAIDRLLDERTTPAGSLKAGASN